mmetsp:Transcript_38574/g.61623  ORF Transcript_38574/g.61623 Transcript_38574/m.61623 type:complete len:283 (+) Transcript_38574:468-1316(+)
MSLILYMLCKDIIKIQVHILLLIIFFQLQQSLILLNLLQIKSRLNHFIHTLHFLVVSILIACLFIICIRFLFNLLVIILSIRLSQKIRLHHVPKTLQNRAVFLLDLFMQHFTNNVLIISRRLQKAQNRRRLLISCVLLKLHNAFIDRQQLSSVCFRCDHTSFSLNVAGGRIISSSFFYVPLGIVFSLVLSRCHDALILLVGQSSVVGILLPSPSFGSLLRLIVVVVLVVSIVIVVICLCVHRVECAFVMVVAMMIGVVVVTGIDSVAVVVCIVVVLIVILRV